MIVDFNFEGKYVVVIGGGAEGYRKTLSFLDAGAKVLVISKTFSAGFKKLNSLRKVKLSTRDIGKGFSIIDDLSPRPDLFIVATNDRNLNLELAKQAKANNCMVLAVDNPSISDFTQLAIARIGDFRIAISTGGKSPAMARVLRKRIEKMIKKEDILQVQLQEFMRGILKQKVQDHKIRRRLLYAILKNDEIRKLLRNDEVDKAKALAMELIKDSLVNYRAQVS
ncbi:MAG: bifunctional precorrin-2 dehydrogenase/sirohydrochlorin ferrochelatase [archaeon]|nr:bifunctional precorrin-2 dehydrogenase/sirohydrochlorin ferrochelatase [archaeon]MCP8306512.1 bifunctional precorrin-2 dehydrogenase/sirohydrochlorin ferrochelatase [archaeon]